jgi:hypothetical protein
MYQSGYIRPHFKDGVTAFVCIALDSEQVLSTLVPP